MKFETIITKGILYDKCENMEELYDDYYYPLLVEFKDLQKQNAELKEENEKLINQRKKAIEYVKEYQRKDEFLKLNEWQTRDLLKILKGDKENER